MKNSITLYLLLVTFLASTVYSFENEELAQKVFEISGIESQAEQFPYSILSDLNNFCEQSGIPAFDDDFLSMTIDTAKAVFKSGLIKNFNKNELKELSRWFESDLGLKIKDIESTNFDKAEYDGSLLPESKNLIDSLVKVAKVKEFNESYAFEMGTTIVKSMTLVSLLKQGKTDEEINTLHSSEKLKEIVKKNVQSTFDINEYYQIYSKLSESEIKDYTNFYKTELGNLYLLYTMSSIRKISLYLYQVVGEKFGNEVDKLKNQN